MPRTPNDVTDAELAVLEVLWDQGTATVRQIKERLYPGNAVSQHATVQKLLDRLKAKKYVKRDRNVWPHLFTATVDRDQLIGQRLRRTAKELCEGNLQPLLTHLIRATKLSAKERQSLRKALEDSDDSK
jgi:predicted transcriptional regulator